MKGFSTKCIHGGRLVIDKVTSHVEPIYQTANFNYKTADEARTVLLGEEKGYIYTRYGNPTVDMLCEKVRTLEEGEGALAFASGMAAISSSVVTGLKTGDHVVASDKIYGGTYEFLTKHLTRMGCRVTFIDTTELENVKNALKKETRIIYAEPLSNPTLDVTDIESLSEIARENDALLLVDNTFTPPPIFYPLKSGADASIHSATKYLSGHGDTIGGISVGGREFIKGLKETMKYYGGVLSPFNAWLILRGIKTMALRLEKNCSNAQSLAEFLEEHPKVDKVNYPGLKSHPQHALAKKMFPSFSGILSFEVKGGYEAGVKVMNSVKLCTITVSLGEVETLIIHPASSSHYQLSPEERRKIGITDGLIRISVGIEDGNDIIEDLGQALERI